MSGEPFPLSLIIAPFSDGGAGLCSVIRANGPLLHHAPQSPPPGRSVKGYLAPAAGLGVREWL